MANIFDYIMWRGDLSLNQSEFNEVDSLILSRFSYLPFDEIMKENEEVTIKELSERFIAKDITKLPILWEGDEELLPAMGNSKRFGTMKAVKYVNRVSSEQEKQFSAITIIMPDDTIYVSYRGTDNTIVGWKEDLNMTFNSHIPSQIDSVIYLEEIAKIYDDKNIRIGGHSKGGNLAIYAAVFASEKVRDRIITVYNNDGPGFNEEIITKKEYKEMIPKINTYIPQTSIFGRLLYHGGGYTVVKSIEHGVMQHDLYSWQVLGNKFVSLEKVTNSSEFIDKSIKKWLEQIDLKTREEVLDIVFSIIYTTKADTFGDIKTNWLENAKILLKAYKQVDAKNKKMIMETLSALFQIIKDNIVVEYKQIGNDKKQQSVSERLN